MGVVNFIREVRKQTLTLSVAALGFVAALVWKDAISKWLEVLRFGDSALGLTLSAVVVTIAVVALTVVLSRLLGEKEQ